jgi:hypothetical protein
MLAAVNSLPFKDMPVIDRGLKSITTEFGLPDVRGLEGITTNKLSEDMRVFW